MHCALPEKVEGYGCPGCPKCPYTKARDIVREEAAKEADRLLDADLKLEDMVVMEHVYHVASRDLAENGGYPSRDWSPEFAHVARIVLYEQNRQEAQESWEFERKMSAKG